MYLQKVRIKRNKNQTGFDAFIKGLRESIFQFSLTAFFKFA